MIKQCVAYNGRAMDRVTSHADYFHSRLSTCVCFVLPLSKQEAISPNPGPVQTIVLLERVVCDSQTLAENKNNSVTSDFLLFRAEPAFGQLSQSFPRVTLVQNVLNWGDSGLRRTHY